MAVLPPIKWSRYIPSDRIPTPKQLAFLMLPHREALYGGAASGGKTEALCMDALRWMDVPGFSCVLFRRKLTDHALKNSCLNRILGWVEPFLKTGEMRYNGNEHTLYSKEGGMMTFGYLDKMDTETRYQGAEYHLAIFDELTQFTKDQFFYLLSRLRRTATTATIPVRMRSGTNPGNRGHGWVKKRFQIERDEDGEFRGKNLSRPFIQAKVKDNPHVNRKQYEANLGELGELEKARLRDGDWSASENAVYKDVWFRNRWMKKGEFYSLVDEKQRRVFHESQVFIFATTDAAASERTGLEGKVFFNNQEPSWSVEGVFGMTPDFDLLWIDNWRGQVTIPNFIHKACEISRVWHPAIIPCEDNSINKGFVQGCQARGLPMYPIPSIADKISRSTSAQLLAEKGKVWLPTYAEWLPDLEDELFVWQGSKGEVDDQIDVLSLAGSYVAAKEHGHSMDPDLASGVFTAHPTSSEGLYPSRIASNDKFDLAVGGLWGKKTW
jgi:predicted phage terminase large subunit-like protein